MCQYLHMYAHQFSMYVCTSVQSLNLVWLFATGGMQQCQASLSITNSWSLLKLMSIESVMPSHHPILCRDMYRGVVKIELLFPEHSWLWGLHSPLVSCVCLESSQLSVLLRDCEITKEDWTLQKEISLWIVIICILTNMQIFVDKIDKYAICHKFA